MSTPRTTTTQIISWIENDQVPDEWAWESAIESAMDESPEDAADAARFLEKLEPGRAWSAAEYHGLMYHHCSGRWESAVHIGYLRANEAFEDALEKYEGNEAKTAQIKKVFAERTASDEAVEKWIRGLVGTHVFDCADGTVLTFDRIFNSAITEEDPT